MLYNENNLYGGIYCMKEDFKFDKRADKYDSGFEVDYLKGFMI